MIISADSNGSYDAEEAIRIGKIMEEHKINLQELNQGKLEVNNTKNKSFKYVYNKSNLLPILYRNNKLYNWQEHKDLYRTIAENRELINLGWKQGRLTINAGGYTFSGSLVHSPLSRLW